MILNYNLQSFTIKGNHEVGKNRTQFVESICKPSLLQGVDISVHK